MARVELLVLGDSSIVVLDRHGQVHEFTDRRLATVAVPERR
jgi:hypothetical protein